MKPKVKVVSIDSSNSALGTFKVRYKYVDIHSSPTYAMFRFGDDEMSAYRSFLLAMEKANYEVVTDGE